MTKAELIKKIESLDDEMTGEEIIYMLTIDVCNSDREIRNLIAKRIMQTLIETSDRDGQNLKLINERSSYIEKFFDGRLYLPTDATTKEKFNQMCAQKANSRVIINLSSDYMK